MSDPAHRNLSVSATPKKERPFWLRALIWVGVAFLLFNTVGAALLYVIGSRPGMAGRVLLVALTIGLPLWAWRLTNVFRTWGNSATANFVRRDDPETGGYLFDVKPARAARMPALPLFVVGLLLLWAFLGGGSGWTYVLALVFLGVGCSFVAPGARHRRRALVSVSPAGLRSGDLVIPVNQVAEFRVAHRGLVVDPDNPVGGLNGVPLSTMLGRLMGRRQAERGYVVEVRADGQGSSTVLAGGLTPDCAEALATDLVKACDAVAGS